MRTQQYSDFQIHALKSALEEISRRDPPAVPRDYPSYPCICVLDDDLCMGCVARNALKAFDKDNVNA